MMTVATTSCLSYFYRSNSVRTSFCYCYKYVIFCAHREQQNRCQWNTTDPSKGIGIPILSDFVIPYRKVTTLIPIALLPSMTAWHRPAVSSLEACQTPAR
jgi:hypothetical protein